MYPLKPKSAVQVPGSFPGVSSPPCGFRHLPCQSPRGSLDIPRWWSGKSPPTRQGATPLGLTTYLRRLMPTGLRRRLPRRFTALQVCLAGVAASCSSFPAAQCRGTQVESRSVGLIECSGPCKLVLAQRRWPLGLCSDWSCAAMTAKCAASCDAHTAEEGRKGRRAGKQHTARRVTCELARVQPQSQPLLCTNVL